MNQVKASSIGPFSFLKYGVLLALLGWTYYPTFLWMWDRWMARDSYYAHGVLIPLVTIFWLFRKKDSLLSTPVEKHPPIYLVLFFISVILQLFSSLFRVYFLSCFSFVFLLLSGVGFLFGQKTLKQTWYPIIFLCLMIPLPLLVISQATLHMKFFVSEISVRMINASGIEAIREGSYIHMPNAVMLVGDPCSGLRSFLAFLCLGFYVAYESRMNLWKKLLIIFTGLPLAIVSNIIRVYSLGILSEIYGNEAIEGKIHDASGYVVFVLAFASLLWMRKWLEEGNQSHD